MTRSSGASDLVDLTLDFRGETDRAICVARSHASGGKAWLPKSQIEFTRQGGIVEVTLPEWLAIERELV